MNAADVEDVRATTRGRGYFWYVIVTFTFTPGFLLLLSTSAVISSGYQRYEIGSFLIYLHCIMATESCIVSYRQRNGLHLARASSTSFSTATVMAIFSLFLGV